MHSLTRGRELDTMAARAWETFPTAKLFKTLCETSPLPLIIPGYYMPMRHAHPTFGGLTERLEVVGGRMGLNADAQPEIIDRSLMTAHNCILNALNVQGPHFNIEGLEEAMQVCYRDFLRVWSPNSLC